MESKTKVKVSYADIQRLVELAFGSVPHVTVQEMTDGWFNTAYKIMLGEGGRQIVLKVGPPADAAILTYEKALLRAEVDAMKLAATNPKIPVPQIIFDDFSRHCLPYDYYFMDFVNGSPWNKISDSLSAEQNSAIEYQLGEITAQINAFEHSTFGYYAFGREFNNWPDTFYWMCSLLFADARRYQIELALSEQEFFAKFDEHYPVFAEVARPQLVHWDLWAGNIFVALDGNLPKITGIIDFERALWGDPLMESYVGKLQQGLSAYMAGYGKDILATRAQHLRRIFYNIYLDIIMIIEDGPRQYDDKSSIYWAQERLQQDINALHHSISSPTASMKPRM